LVTIGQFVIPRPKPSREFQLRTIMSNQESAILIALVLLLVIVGINNPRFLATRNILDVLQGNAYIAVAAIGMSMVIITGNIDISVGSLIGLLAIVSGRLVVGGAPIWVAWLAPLILGAAIGAGIGSGTYKNATEAFSNFKPIKVVEPTNAKGFNELYLDWHKSLEKYL
jgi:ribose/xylose/arabinose/galactoside ABC-type transport system permease subunit